VHAHIVLAHPAANSYNAHLANCARRTLEAEGWTTTLSDFYRMDFDPCERASHFSAPLEPTRFDVQAEQRHASAEGTVPPEVAAEIGHLDRADLLILQYPMWWHLPPAMLKGWLDRVLIYGAIYTSKKRFEHGRFAGKRAMLSLTVGTSEETYAFNGRSGDIDLLLWPVNFTLAYVGAVGSRSARVSPLQQDGALGKRRPRRVPGTRLFAVHPAQAGSGAGVRRNRIRKPGDDKDGSRRPTE
jgi:NAD(P)H dehydrogenase (quinone)